MGRGALPGADAGEAAGALPAVKGAEAGLDKRDGFGSAMCRLKGNFPGLCHEVKLSLAGKNAGGGAATTVGPDAWLLSRASCPIAAVAAAGCMRLRFDVLSWLSIKSKMSDERLTGQGRCSAALNAWLGHEKESKRGASCSWLTGSTSDTVPRDWEETAAWLCCCGMSSASGNAKL